MRTPLTLLALSGAMLFACDDAPAAPHGDASPADTGLPLPGDPPAPDATTPADAAPADARIPEDARMAPEDAAREDASRDDASPEDAHTPDGSASCDVDARASDGTCTAYVCETQSGTALALERDGTWQLGGLEWASSICRESLGWPSAFTSDRATLLFALTRAQHEALSRGMPVYVDWGSVDPLASTAERCAVRIDSELPSCPVPAAHAARLPATSL